ncbi:Cdc6/Cdc18 family protein [Halovenus marina]|uniref:Cdc6/Cdc18 family protein n=1 Tax=Halovenus marina TaxID=3396621 RepID=UPI003F55A911
MFDKSKASKGVLRSETYLNTGYQPEKPIGRDNKIERIANAVRPLTQRKQPENLLVHGPAGVGKTTCVKHVFNQLENETSARSIYINCWKYNTRSSLLTQLLIELGYPAPRKGKPVDELLSKIREWLDKKRNVALALDEFDQLDQRTEIIYDLQTLNEEAENQVGIIMVSNHHPSKLKLDPRSRSRLNCQTLQFQPYNQDQLKNILKKRVEQAFRPGTAPEKVIKEIAETVAENSGDCRQAIETLLRAGRRADQENTGKVKLEHL